MLAFVLQLATVASAAPAAVADDCNRSRGDDIVICGSRPGHSPYRLPKLPERYDRKQVRAETDLIPGVHSRAHVDSVNMPDGYRGNRVMLTLSTPF